MIDDLLDAPASHPVAPDAEEPEPYLDPADVARDGRFLCAARAWVESGANCLPCAIGAKSPAISGWGAKPAKPSGAWLARDWGIGEGALHGSDAPKIPIDRYRDLTRQWREHGTLVFPATIGATVIDVDDLSLLPAVLEACGDTPYRTYSGRAGGGVHLWYSGATRSRNAVIPHVDVKSSGGYVIAPGSLHESTRREYQPSPALAEALAARTLRFPQLRSDWLGRLRRTSAGLTRPTRIDLASLADQIKQHARTKEVGRRLRLVADGKPLAEHGERDGALYACLATLAEHWPRAEEDALLALFAPALDAWQTDDAETGRVDSDWHAICAEKWGRLAGEQIELERELDEHEAERRRAAWELAGVEECTDPADPTEAPIVVHRGRSYYLRIGTHWHGPIAREDIGVDTIGLVRALYGVDVADFQALMSQYGRLAREVSHSYLVQRSQWRRGVLTLAAGERRDLEPAYSETVARGIEALAGPYADHLRHWIAGLTRFDRPCRALVLSGPRGVGKTLLFRGMSRIWLAGASKMRHVLGRRFNDSALRAPLALADDDTSDAEQGQALASYLREAVADREQQVERKFLDVQTVRGSLRFALATNNPMELVQGAVSHKHNDESVAAFADRLLHIPVAVEAVGWWEHGAHVGETVEARTARLVDGDEIAQHALWLAQRPEHGDERDRFWVQAADQSLHALAMLSSGMRGDILLRLAAIGTGAGGVTMAPDGSAYWVHVQDFIRAWNIDAPRGWSLRTGGLSLRALAAAHAQPDPPGKGRRAISAALVAYYAERCGI